jgi:hypothetical protein
MDSKAIARPDLGSPTVEQHGEWWDAEVQLHRGGITYVGSGKTMESALANLDSVIRWERERAAA